MRTQHANREVVGKRPCKKSFNDDVADHVREVDKLQREPVGGSDWKRLFPKKRINERDGSSLLIGIEENPFPCINSTERSGAVKQKEAEAIEISKSIAAGSNGIAYTGKHVKDLCFDT